MAVMLTVLGVLGRVGAGAIGKETPRARPALGGALLVTQLPVQPGVVEDGWATGGMLRTPYGAGARLCVVSPEGTVRVLAEDFHSACEGAVSFDGKRVLFAGKESGSDPWDIYEIGVNGLGIRRITRDVGNCRNPSYQSRLYTITSPEPWYQITFVSDAANEANDYGPVRATDLYSCRLDGTRVRRLTFNPSSDMDPFLMSDGRLLFAAWQRSGLSRGLFGRVSLFEVGIDGTDCVAFLVDEGRRIKHMPCTTAGGLAVFVEADRVGWDGAGCLSRVTLRRPLHSYRRITAASDGLFHSPSPLSDGTVLVSRRPADGSGTHGVYCLDPVSGRSECVFDDPARHDVYATVIRPRREPDGRSTVVTEDDPNGKLYCLNVYTSDLADRTWMPPGTVKSVRVLAGLPRHTGEEEDSPEVPSLIPRRVLGQAPVEADGSFNIDVPANTPIELQILDADGAALRTCSWIWARNHEPRGCIGCHEDGELTPENRFQDAFERNAVSLHSPPRPTVDFRRHIMPIVAAKCVSCHGPNGAVPRLDGADGTTAGEPSRRIYQTLLAADTLGAEGEFVGSYVQPGQARNSPLVWHVYGRNTARPWDGASAERPIKPMPGKATDSLSDRERQTFVEWIDLGARWAGEGE